MLVMPRLRSSSPAARACASPVSFSGISMLPCDRPCAFQSVSPCRRYQNGMGCRVSSGESLIGQARPSCCNTRCTAGRASMRSRCAAQFGGSVMPTRLPRTQHRTSPNRRWRTCRPRIPCLPAPCPAGRSPFRRFPCRCAFTASSSAAFGREIGRAEHAREALHVDGRDGVIHQLQRRVPADRYCRATGWRRDWCAPASRRSPEIRSGPMPSSRTSVGTFDFGLTAVKSGLYCAPSRRLTASAS